MKLGSLFDGSGGFPLAGIQAGITPVWASEIEPYPMRVTAARFPDMKQLGDVTKIDGRKIEPVDVITFGSPCQDLSAAGKQAGIHEGKRSCLFFEAIRIIKEMRCETNGQYPKYAVWENVPGAFSSNRGEDFRAVLEAFVEAIEEKHIDVPRPDKWRGAGSIRTDHGSVAWRALDAQYWGVPQRRRRIYLVADLRGQRAAEILFKRKGLRGDAAESGALWQGNSGATENCAGAAGFCTEHSADRQGIGCDQTVFVPFVKGARPHSAEEAPTWKYGEVANTLNAYDVGETRCNELAVKAYSIGNGQTHNCTMAEVSNTLDCMHDQQAILKDTYIVRRLTPLECCRLQGFPDWWEDGVEGSDTARYKMWGNGIALPCAQYVMEGIVNGSIFP